MTRWLYSWLMWLAQPLLRRKLQRRGQQEPGYRQAIPERFGHYHQLIPPHAGPTVWSNHPPAKPGALEDSR